MNQLDVRFRKTWNALGLSGEPTGAMSWLQSRYSAPDRHYHTLAHIGIGLNAINILDNSTLDSTERDLLEFAWWYHDSAPNEATSAAAASMVLFMGRKPELCEKSENLILVTSHRKEPQTYTERIIVDADLAIFAATGLFGDYEKNVRKEYAGFSDSDYAKGRVQILKMFLDRKNIYHTIYAQSKWEAVARENLEASVKRLECGR